MAFDSFNRKYLLKLWLLTVVIIGPILLAIESIVHDPDSFKRSEYIGVILLFISFGLFLSLPTFLIAWMFYWLIGQKLSPGRVKLLLAGISIVGVYVTFFLIGGSMARISSFIYAASIIVSGLILRLRRM